MSTTIINDEGNEEVVFTQAELDAQKAAEIEAIKAEYEKQLAEKDAHVKEKLDQFQKAKSSIDIEKEEINAKVAEAMRIAEEAKMSVAQSKEAELAAKKTIWVQSVAGNDPELTKKIEEAYGMLNLPATSDAEIQARVQKAVALAGITQMPHQNISFSGSYAPNVTAANDQGKQAEYEAWKKELHINL